MNGSDGSVERVTSSPSRVAAGDRRHVQRAGQEVDDRVEHRLDALVLQGRAGQHRDDLVGQRSDANRAAQLVGTDLLALEELVRDVVVEVGQRLDHLLAPFVGDRLDLGRDVTDLDLVPQVVAVGDRLHVDEVDDAAERVLGADRHLERDGVHAEAVADHVDHAPEVGARAVELVDEAEARDGVLVGLAPDGLGLRLDAGHAVEDDDRAVEHAKAALDLDREVHVPGRVDQVDAMIVPEAGRGGRGDRDPPLLLLLHPVHRGGALVDLAELVDLLRVEEDPLGHGGLAGVDVGDDPDIPGALERRVRAGAVGSGGGAGSHRPTT